MAKADLRSTLLDNAWWKYHSPVPLFFPRYALAALGGKRKATTDLWSDPVWLFLCSQGLHLCFILCLTLMSLEVHLTTLGLGLQRQIVWARQEEASPGVYKSALLSPSRWAQLRTLASAKGWRTVSRGGCAPCPV